MKKEILDPEHLYNIHKEGQRFHLIGETLAGMSKRIDIISSCLFLNDKFDDFKKCYWASIDDLRHSEEIYGFGKFEDEE